MRPLCIPVLFLLACASAPKVEYPDLDLAQPDQWTAGASEGTVADQWWRDMGTARLDSLVALALEHNYNLKIAGARLAQAQAQARASWCTALAPIRYQCQWCAAQTEFRRLAHSWERPESGLVLREHVLWRRSDCKLGS